MTLFWVDKKLHWNSTMRFWFALWVYDRPIEYFYTCRIIIVLLFKLFYTLKQACVYQVWQWTLESRIRGKYYTKTNLKRFGCTIARPEKCWADWTWEVVWNILLFCANKQKKPLIRSKNTVFLIYVRTFSSFFKPIQ